IIPKHSIGLGSPLSIQVKFPVAITVLPSLSFILTGTSINHPNDSVICLELPFISKSDGLSAFHPRALITPLFKNDSEIDKSFILAFRYCRDENHSSDSSF